MILEDLYTVISSKTTEENSFEVTVQLEKDHKIYKGHFPDNPVTPGVSMLQIIKNNLEKHFQTKLFLSSATNVKFLKAIDPRIHSDLVFTFSYTIEKEYIIVKNHTSLSDGTPVLKCNAKFVKK